MKSDAVEALFEKYYNDALLYTLTMSKNIHQAEEIVSSAFFKALNTADKQIENFKPWLLRVCRNECYDYHRRKKREQTLEDEIGDDAENALDKIIKEEEFRALHRAIGLLADAQREIVLLYYFEDMKVSEVAQVTGKSEISVRVTLCRARDELKKKLEVIYGF